MFMVGGPAVRIVDLTQPNGRTSANEKGPPQGRDNEDQEVRQLEKEGSMRKNRRTLASPMRCPHVSPSMRAFLVSAIGFGVLLSACAKRSGAVATEQPSQITGAQAAGRGAEGGAPSSSLPVASERVTPTSAPPREQPVAQAAQAAYKESPLKDIFFDFDRSEIRPDAKAPLSADVAWLKVHPKAAVTIEGHCDERGTIEYNLALGGRRAKASKDYLVAAGVNGSRLKTMSYGKERPFVLGHDESAWKWNRRDHFVVVEP